MTSYNYCSNNPINRIDPDGREDESAQISPAGILLEAYLQADAAVFNFMARGVELLGYGKPGVQVRKELPYDKNGFLTSNKNTIVEKPTNSALQETKEVIGDALALLPVTGSAKGLSTPILAFAKAPGAKSALVRFIKNESGKAVEVITNVPQGYKLTKLKSQGQKVFSNGTNYISPDVTSHKGGVWKMFDNVKKIGSSNKQDRVGTFDANLKKIGD